VRISLSLSRPCKCIEIYENENKCVRGSEYSGCEIPGLGPTNSRVGLGAQHKINKKIEKQVGVIIHNLAAFPSNFPNQILSLGCRVSFVTRPFKARINLRPNPNRK
jgi:hypothetical protein